jgi:hypothetical protein
MYINRLSLSLSLALNPFIYTVLCYTYLVSPERLSYFDETKPQKESQNVIWAGQRGWASKVILRSQWGLATPLYEHSPVMQHGYWIHRYDNKALH